MIAIRAQRKKAWQEDEQVILIKSYNRIKMVFCRSKLAEQHNLQIAICAGLQTGGARFEF